MMSHDRNLLNLLKPCIKLPIYIIKYTDYDSTNENQRNGNRLS